MKFIPIKNDWEMIGEVGDIVAIVGYPWEDEDGAFKLEYDIVELDYDSCCELCAPSSKISTILGYYKINEPKLICNNKIFSIQ